MRTASLQCARLSFARSITAIQSSVFFRFGTPKTANATAKRVSWKKLCREYIRQFFAMCIFADKYFTIKSGSSSNESKSRFKLPHAELKTVDDFNFVVYCRLQLRNSPLQLFEDTRLATDWPSQMLLEPLKAKPLQLIRAPENRFLSANAIGERKWRKILVSKGSKKTTSEIVAPREIEIQLNADDTLATFIWVKMPPLKTPQILACYATIRANAQSPIWPARKWRRSGEKWVARSNVCSSSRTFNLPI